jgi:hypothetical protein
VPLKIELAFFAASTYAATTIMMHSNVYDYRKARINATKNILHRLTTLEASIAAQRERKRSAIAKARAKVRAKVCAKVRAEVDNRSNSD